MTLVTDQKLSNHDNDNMKITPLDIRKKEFPIKLRGVDSGEVNAFLSLVREQMEDLIREIALLKEEGAKREKELEDYRVIETELQNTVICTHKMIENYKQVAEKELDIKFAEAESIRNRIIEEAEHKYNRLQEEIEYLKDIKRNIKLQLKIMIDGHMKILESHDDIEHVADSKTRNNREEEKGQCVA